ncbi:MAG: hypothetical protein ACXAEF_13180 [Candidatus Thorarchaeota archaeon]|jgi:hypothetical protein
MKKGEALPHFIGQLVLGILQIIAIIATILYYNELGVSLLGPSMYGNMMIWTVLIGGIFHGFWRIVDNFAKWRNAD